MYGMPTVWEDIGCCTNQHRCALVKYLFNVLSYLYAVKIDCAINAPGHINNVVNILNAVDKCFI